MVNVAHSPNNAIVVRFQQGDALAFDEFVTKNSDLIWSIVHSSCSILVRFNKGYDQTEAYNLALFHTFLAMKDFELERGFQFTTFMYPRVYYGIRHDLGFDSRTVKRMSKYKIISLDEEIGNDKDGNAMIVADKVESTNAPLSEYLLFCELEDVISHLDEEEEVIFYLRFIEGLTQVEIGQQIGKGQVHVSRKLTKIKNYLKIHF